MPIYTPPTEDMQYLLHDVLKIGGSGIPGYAELDREFTGAILGEAGKLAAEVLAPLNASGDAEGCQLENGVVRTPAGFKAAYDQICAGGWIGLDMPEEVGGQNMPYLINSAVGEMFVSANMALNMYQGLSHGAMSAILAHGSDEQKATYVPKMVAGTWSGTMNLTEPQCGTDLGLIRTRAEPQEDGTYAITGTKIWISAGEHDLTENIVHLVLARIPGGPEGIKGISLFIVPKFLPDENGAPGRRNGVACGGLEQKMGIHANATCVMNYDGATGFLIGEEHKGMRAMFTMMNEARLGVGLQGYAQGAVAYQNALAFAQERLQGRALGDPANPAGPADPILVHPDVRRNLMDQKSFVEGARALTFWGAQMIDRAHRMQDPEAEAMISLLTPVIKGFLTDKGFETTVLAQQTYGGTGFTRAAGAEQFVRDARIAMIYEGTNGVQSLDLVGRKLGLNGGKAVMAFFELVKAFIAEHEDDAALKQDFLDPLKSASKDLQAAATYFMAEGMKTPENALAGSYDFMHLFGHVCLGLMWSRMAVASRAALAAAEGNAAFHEAKLVTGRYYMARQLPATALHLARIRSGAEPVMALDAANF
ncbi:acyl-CoA dehydrogenase C-terminal domain-containing protein [Rhodovulum sulfidophilum]|uniref:Acyl-CoA dehydrogenase C-terminal domain-containing protein n=1 Tax=Rhodovulum sulfidophilum TaxID=35806 RepID=A0ABS1RQU9_RHOSU|nr:acyl-CoA dehydrogenase C-terminal domain-containing protein [Rhodovulum sulfidophilum]MBL3608446.1 acyl-CoA dehydrogenase C-terminal domain-containing protein [Rhodovulum sulfidophilum]MCE8456182.1 acyl-CoA dehydrogenase C-terminal domain-containing protein [Rhodovulum sulfidophilum]